MKTIIRIFAISLLLHATFSYSQDCDFYYPTREGTTLELSHFDKKGKLTGKSIQTIKEVKNLPEGYSVTSEMSFIDEKEEKVFQDEITFRCQDGKFIAEMENYLANMNMEAYANMNLTVESDELEMPTNPQPGEALNDGTITVTIENEGIKFLTMSVHIFNRKVEGIEEVTTPAGTFTCYKISYDTEFKSILSVKASGTEWYAKNTGLIKSETYNKKGKITGYSILSALK